MYNREAVGRQAAFIQCLMLALMKWLVPDCEPLHLLSHTHLPKLHSLSLIITSSLSSLPLTASFSFSLPHIHPFHPHFVWVFFSHSKGDYMGISLTVGDELLRSLCCCSDDNTEKSSAEKLGVSPVNLPYVLKGRRAIKAPFVFNGC